MEPALGLETAHAVITSSSKLAPVVFAAAISATPARDTGAVIADGVLYAAVAGATLVAKQAAVVTCRECAAADTIITALRTTAQALLPRQWTVSGDWAAVLPLTTAGTARRSVFEAGRGGPTSGVEGRGLRAAWQALESAGYGDLDTRVCCQIAFNAHGPRSAGFTAAVVTTRQSWPATSTAYAVLRAHVRAVADPEVWVVTARLPRCTTASTRASNAYCIRKTPTPISHAIPFITASYGFTSTRPFICTQRQQLVQATPRHYAASSSLHCSKAPQAEVVAAPAVVHNGITPHVCTMCTSRVKTGTYACVDTPHKHKTGCRGGRRHTMAGIGNGDVIMRTALSR